MKPCPACGAPVRPNTRRTTTRTTELEYDKNNLVTKETVTEVVHEAEDTAQPPMNR